MGPPHSVRHAIGRARAFLRRPSWARFFTISGGLLATILMTWLVLTWSRPIDMELVTRTWTRTTALQVWSPVSRESWCDSMSGGAYSVSRSSRVHHYNKIPDGEDCHVEAGSCSQSCSQVDHGNGSFSEVCTESCSSDRTVCTTRYREEPVYADYCHYTVDEWVTRREQTAEGVWPQRPVWPEIAARTCGGAPHHGCEQTVHAHQRYDLHLRATGVGSAGVSTICAVAEGAWTHAREGSRWRLRRRVVSGWIDCDSLTLLRPAPAA